MNTGTMISESKQYLKAALDSCLKRRNIYPCMHDLGNSLGRKEFENVLQKSKTDRH